MKTPFTLLFLLLVSCSLIIAQDKVTESAPPRIIKTIPEFGDCDVDHSINEIKIIFDQDMSKGMSVVNTSYMPQKNGNARWDDDRTFVLPVILRPNIQLHLTV
jgi:hypothetical protein